MGCTRQLNLYLLWLMRDDLKADKVLAWIGKLLKCLCTEYQEPMSS